MKKIKFIGLATAALLAVSPIVASTANTVNADTTMNVSNYSFSKVPLNGTIDAGSIQNMFGKNAQIETSYVETRVAGVYPITVKAGINTYNFNVTVGEQHDVKSLTGDNDSSAIVYQINGDDVIDSAIAIQNGTSVSTYGTITVDGKSYTRLNSANSDLYIKSDWFTGAYDDEDEAVTKFTMHKAIIYDKDGKSTGSAFRQFRNIEVYPDTVNMNGKTYYRLYNTWKYVNAANIDGTQRTLKKNAYIYKTGKQRANKKVLKKGSKVTTYGSSFKFANGKTYYRIGKGKQYVRTANF